MADLLSESCNGRGVSPREIGKHLSCVKVVGRETALNVTKGAIEILGAYGE